MDVESPLELLFELESDEELSVAPTLGLVALDESLVSVDLDSLLDSLPPFSAGGVGRPLSVG